ncbi:MAG: FAD-dependent oxidoreductase [Candidatus Hadarchaeales archaeon]
MNFDIVVVGGSSSGIAAALTAARRHPDKNIAVVRREEKALVPCSLPYLFHTLDSPLKALISDEVLSKVGVELLIAEVTSLKGKEQKLLTSEGEVRYQRLILATGSLPLPPPFPGGEKERVFVMRKELEYVEKMRASLRKAGEVVIVGGGFVGVELAEELAKAGKKVKVVELLPRCLSSGFDEEVSMEVEGVLRERGVEILTGKRVKEVMGKEEVEGVRLESGEELSADVVVVSTGLSPEVKLAREGGLVLGPTGGIAVDEYQRTSDPHILACGDCAEKRSFFTGKPVKLMLASIGALEGRIAGSNPFHNRRKNPGVIGTFLTTVGETVFASTGLTEEMAKREGFRVLMGRASSSTRHPKHLPGASTLKVKLVCEEGTGLLLGGQVVGGRETAELINLLGAYLLQRAKVEDLSLLQHGTHPLLTPSPVAHSLHQAAEEVMDRMHF